MSTAERGTHVPALDGLRGLAVAGVVAFHLGTVGDAWGPTLAGGWLGVDVFFTLSGFLITSLLLAEAGRSTRIDLVAFWRRRLRRLQPAAIVAIAGIVATARWWAPAGTADSTREQALAALAGLANWQSLWADRAYAAGEAPSAFEHFWSLGVEEQFYVLWPLLVAGLALLLRRRLVSTVRAVALAGIAGSWALLAVHDLQRGYLGTDSRVGSILLGAALATVLPLGAPAVGDRARRAAAAAGWAGAGVTAVLWAVAGWPPDLPLEVVLPVQGLATVGLLVGLTAAPASVPARVLAVRPLATLGRVSYGVYLWHWPVLVVLTPTRLGLGGAATTVVRLAATAVLVALSYRFVERPIRIGAALRRTRVAFPVAVAGVAAFALVGVRGVASEPAWARADGSLIRGETPVADVAPTPDGRAPERVLVVGDSIATSLVSGPVDGMQPATGHLFEHLAERGIEAAGATMTGCPVLDHVFVADGEPNRSCTERIRRRLPPAMASFRPDLVVWYSRQETYPFLLEDGSVSSSDRELKRRYAERLRWFADRGARVLLVSPGPNGDGWGWNAPEGDPELMERLDAVLEQVAAENPDVVTGLVRMEEVLCGGAETGCPDVGPGGGRFRVDGVHFLGPEETVASEWLADRIAEVRFPAGDQTVASRPTSSSAAAEPPATRSNALGRSANQPTRAGRGTASSTSGTSGNQ
jgi:peptidoglycan/LPS O-acetylase OafA/YrhL